jgi:hypothetical protein
VRQCDARRGFVLWMAISAGLAGFFGGIGLGRGNRRDRDG